MAILHRKPDFPMPKGPLGPSNSTICLRTAPERLAKGLEFMHIGHRQRQNQKKTTSRATWLKTRFPAHQIHPQPPTFGGFHPSKFP